MTRVVDKFVAELEVQLADRKVFIELATARAAGWRRRGTIGCMAPVLWDA